MELPTYTFSNPNLDSTTLDLSGLCDRLKEAITKDLDSELKALEGSSLDWEKILEASPQANLAPVLEEAFQERSRQLSGTPAYMALLNRRGRLGLLSMRTTGEGKEIRLEVAPGHVVAALEAQTGDWWRLELEKQMAGLCSKTGGAIPSSGFLIKAEHIPEYVPPSSTASEEVTRDAGDSRVLNAMRRFAAAFMVVPIALVAVILFLFYDWVADVKGEYEDLKNTVNVQKEQIIEVIEEGVKTSTDVMDLFEYVKDATLGDDSEEDSEGQVVTPVPNLDSAKNNSSE